MRQLIDRKVFVKSDADNNGRVTMEEAFIYAKDKDRASDEHPMYTSTPISVGEDLAFTHLAPAVDLYMKDNPEDTGKEPNTTTNEFWKSPQYGFAIKMIVFMDIKIQNIHQIILWLL